MTKRTTPTVRLRNRILAIVTGSLINWSQGGSIDVTAVHAEIDTLIDAALVEDARQREARRRRQVAELLRSRR